MSDTVFVSAAQLKLWDAAARGDSAAIRELAFDDIDLALRNEDGLTAFALATRNNHADAAMTILAIKEAQFMRQIGLPAELPDESTGKRKSV